MLVAKSDRAYFGGRVEQLVRSLVTTEKEHGNASPTDDGRRIQARPRAVPLRRVHARFQAVRNATTAARLQRRTVPAVLSVDVPRGQAGAAG